MALSAQGSLLYVETGSPGVFTPFAELTNVALTNTVDEHDVTIHNDGSKFRRWLMIEHSHECAIDGFYVPSDTTHNSNADTGMIGLFTAGSIKVGKIIWPDSTEFQFHMLVRDITHNAVVDDVLGFNMVARLTSVVDFHVDGAQLGNAEFGDEEFGSPE